MSEVAKSSSGSISPISDANPIYQRTTICEKAPPLLTENLLYKPSNIRIVQELPSPGETLVPQSSDVGTLPQMPVCELNNILLNFVGNSYECIVGWVFSVERLALKYYVDA